MDINDLLRMAVTKKASDIHLTVGLPAMMRVNGRLMPFENSTPLTPQDTEHLAFSLIHEEHVEGFKKSREIDVSYALDDLGRFRVNVYWQQNNIAVALRLIPTEIPTPEQIGLTAQVINLTNLKNGLVLVTGPTGSGKSTTLAALINHINRNKNKHIITIEDPIEFVYKSDKSMINQREVGEDTLSFSNALKSALREDPDVILVGEMRDLETIAATLTIAETGHLAFATLHTNDVSQTIDRIIDVFPPHQQQQIRMMLSVVLKGVICQQLLPTANGSGRVAAREILFSDTAVANMIREGASAQIYSRIQTGGNLGMRTLDADIMRLLQEGSITKEVAKEFMVRPGQI